MHPMTSSVLDVFLAELPELKALASNGLYGARKAHPGTEEPETFPEACDEEAREQVEA
jgi:hypothetical protein